MHRHNVLDALTKIHVYFRTNPSLQLLILTVYNRLLECNYTRGLIIKEDCDVLAIVFSIVHLFMNSKSHVDMGLKCIIQCARSEYCRCYIIENNLVAYLITFVKRYPAVPSILRSLLKLFNWVTTTQARMEYVAKLKVSDCTAHWCVGVFELLCSINEACWLYVEYYCCCQCYTSTVRLFVLQRILFFLLKICLLL